MMENPSYSDEDVRFRTEPFLRFRLRHLHAVIALVVSCAARETLITFNYRICENTLNCWYPAR